MGLFFYLIENRIVFWWERHLKLVSQTQWAHRNLTDGRGENVRELHTVGFVSSVYTFLLMPASWHSSGASKGKHVAKWYIKALYNILIIFFKKGTTFSALLLLTSPALYSPPNSSGHCSVFLGNKSKTKQNSHKNFWCFNRVRFPPVFSQVQGFTLQRQTHVFWAKTTRKNKKLCSLLYVTVFLKLPNTW